MGSSFTQLRPRVIFVEGNIGSGKSELLKELEKLGEHVVLEDVGQWRFLNARYTDPHRWGFAFQVEILVSMAASLRAALKTTPRTTPIFMERSFDSALVFIELLFENQFISVSECVVLRQLAAVLREEFAGLDTTYIWMSCSPDECLARVQKRSRESEAAALTIHDLHGLENTMDQQLPPAEYCVDTTLSSASQAQELKRRFSE